MKQPSLHPERPGLAARPADRVWLHVVILVLLGCAVMLPRLGQESVLDGAEVREAEIARETACSGDYVVPRLLGASVEVTSTRTVVQNRDGTLTTKILPGHIDPPVFRWMAAALFRVTGRSDFAMARLPSALLAVAAAVAVYLLGRCWFRPQAGLWAGILWLTFPLVVQWGRTSRPDMAMAALVLYGILFATWAVDTQRVRASAAFWCGACLFIAAATMAGGLKAVFYFAVPMAIIWRVHRKRWLPPVGYWASAVGLVLVAAAAWLLLAEIRQPGNLRALAGRRFAEALSMDWRVWLPVEQLLLWTLPWAVVAVGAGYAAVRRVQFRGFDRLAIPAAWMFVGLLALMIAPDKDPRRLLPLAPFWALFLGGFLDEVARAASAFGGPARRWLLDWPLRVELVLMVAVACAFPVLWMHHSERAVIGAAIACALAGALATYGAATAFEGRAVAAFRGMAGAALIAAIAAWPLRAQWTAANPDPTLRAAMELARHIPSDSPVVAWRLHDPLLFFKMNRRTEFPRDEADLAALLAKPGPHYVIVPVSETGTIARLAPTAVASPGQWKLSAAGGEFAILEVVPSGN